MSESLADIPHRRPAACLYRGDVMHQRMKPAGHRFRYAVWSLMIDLDRLGEADRTTRLFSVNRPNAVSFCEADHLGGSDEATLRSRADGLLRKAGLTERAATIRLACYPRIFGQVFNPISVYYAESRDGALVALIYEVRNTFGERHTYVCPVTPDQESEAGIRQSRSKRFYVSPFIDLEQRYHFRMNRPGDELKWRILETDSQGPLLAATYHGRQMPLTAKNLVSCFLNIPLLTWKIVGGIHWEALKLWLKGVPYFSRPAPPEAASYNDGPEPFRQPSPERTKMTGGAHLPSREGVMP